MSEAMRAISVKVPESVYSELCLRVPEGDRGAFVRDAIVEKLEKTPKADRVLELEGRFEKMWQEFAHVKKYLADLEMLTYEHGKVNPHQFCLDDMDHKIVDYLVHYKGGTTPELAEYLETNRWLVLNRLRRLQKNSRKQLGKPIIDFCAGERSGKKKAWWINKELTET